MKVYTYRDRTGTVQISVNAMTGDLAEAALQDKICAAYWDLGIFLPSSKDFFLFSIRELVNHESR
jgi:hypothetical protein